MDLCRCSGNADRAANRAGIQESGLGPAEVVSALRMNRTFQAHIFVRLTLGCGRSHASRIPAPDTGAQRMRQAAAATVIRRWPPDRLVSGPSPRGPPDIDGARRRRAPSQGCCNERCVRCRHILSYFPPAIITCGARDTARASNASAIPIFFSPSNFWFAWGQLNCSRVLRMPAGNPLSPPGGVRVCGTEGLLLLSRLAGCRSDR